jgi:ABC-type oligopeptide transport system substrate-binding subunit
MARAFAKLGVLIVLACGLMFETPPTVAQVPQADPAKKQAKKPRVEEEEEPAKVPSKVPVRVEDGKPGGSASALGLPTNLLREAETAKHEAIRALYTRLAVAHDEIAGRNSDNWIEPVARYIGPNPNAEEPYKVRHIDQRGNFIKEEKLPGSRGLVHYEALALAQVDAFVKNADKSGLPLLEALQHAEKVLAEVVRFHETARERGQRAGAGWDDATLRARLLTYRLQRLQALADAQNWPAVKELASLLAFAYPNHPEVREIVIQVQVRQAQRAIQTEQSIEVRRILDGLAALFPNSHDVKEVSELHGKLQTTAKMLAKKVEQLPAKDKEQASKQLSLIESIWPQLPELPQLRRKFQLDQVLYVGVPHLPAFMSPAMAATDADRQVLDLLFESLVRPVADPAVGQGYEPVLAVGSPRLMALGREFQLTRDARWYREGRGSDVPTVDEPLRAADVRSMLVRYQNESPCSPQWKEILAGARSEGDPFRLELTMHQGYLDPLSLMTFKILPSGQTEDTDFARRPIGSGPYMYMGEEQRTFGPAKERVTCAVFRANPTYGARAGKKGLPFIREICFYSTRERDRDPRRDFKFIGAHPHLWLDVTTEQIQQIRSKQAKLDDVKVVTLPNRRVYFLAVNHRHEPLRNQDLRRALAMAIDRDSILEIFRNPLETIRKPHRALNGPYPAESWATDKTVPSKLFDLKQASTQASLAKASGIMLELKYPSDSAEVAKACERIRDDVSENTGKRIAITLKACSPAELRKAVEVDHDYQLAYYHWDHPDDSFWLWPLFDPESTGKGGKNYLGFGDTSLSSLFRRALQYREFSEVQRQTHMIHRRLYDTMPLIPLWQLDSHVAIHDQLQTVPRWTENVNDRTANVDPLRLFTHAELWQLAK